MKLAIVTAYPPSKVTLTEYGYHLVKHFRLQEEVSEIVLITDKTEGEKDLSFSLMISRCILSTNLETLR